ncbi:hypothetical protein HJD18_10075 [Thermoleophilia bacterium SCSIO 60948]|nr:hypothetical protein HJD18_10075 [Thermoleophilia bacterium SCSIO 60948]
MLGLAMLHAWAIPTITARRGARSIVPLGSERSAAHDDSLRPDSQRVALGLLADLLGHRERELMSATGLALQRGALGTWLVGEQGAALVRCAGRRTDCWCVRIRDVEELPAADRVAHLLLALREDERGFAKVANLAFSGATGRIRRRLPSASRAAIVAAREIEESRARGPATGATRPV